MLLKEKNTTFAVGFIHYSTFKNMEIQEYRQLILDELLARKMPKESQLSTRKRQKTC